MTRAHLAQRTAGDGARPTNAVGCAAGAYAKPDDQHARRLDLAKRVKQRRLIRRAADLTAGAQVADHPCQRLIQRRRWPMQLLIIRKHTHHQRIARKLAHITRTDTNLQPLHASLTPIYFSIPPAKPHYSPGLASRPIATPIFLLYGWQDMDGNIPGKAHTFPLTTRSASGYAAC